MEKLDNYYELLGIPMEANLQQIKKAYRNKALTCHPDKVGPHDLEAAALFHTLSLAVEILSNPDKRREYDGKIQKQMAQKQRFDKMEATRRSAREQLEARELEALSRKTASHQKIAAEIIKEQERAKMQSMEENLKRTTSILHEKASTSEPNLLDSCLKITWKKSIVFSEIGFKQNVLDKVGVSVDRVIVSAKGKRNAMLLFASLQDAKTVYKEREKFPEFEWTWPSGKEPSLTETSHLEKNPTNLANWQSSTPLEDYESIILAKMRQKKD